MHDNWNEHERGGKWMSQKQEGDKVSVNAKKKCRQAIFISYCNPCVSECWRCTLQNLGPWHTCAANESANVINENDFLLFVFCHWFRFVFSLFFFDQHTLILRIVFGFWFCLCVSSFWREWTERLLTTFQFERAELLNWAELMHLPETETIIFQEYLQNELNIELR